MHSNIGYAAGEDNKTGWYNSCLGAGAGGDMGEADGNTMVGFAAGHNTEYASQCTFVGANAGWDNNRTNDRNNAARNTYIGYDTGSANREGEDNVGMGAWANFETNGVSGNKNNRTVFMGASAVLDGNDIITIGYGANIDANNSIAIGSNTFIDNNNSVAIGYQASVTPAQSIAIGAESNVTGTNSIAIGYQVSVTAANKVYVGNDAMSTIGGVVNWTATSDGRFKYDVRADVPGLDFINRLRPVTYHFDARKLLTFHHDCTEDLEAAFAEKENTRYTGFIAQEVEEAAKQCGYEFSGVDVPQNENEVYGLRYAEFNVPLTKAVQELDQKLNKHQADLDQILATVKMQQEQITSLSIPK